MNYSLNWQGDANRKKIYLNFQFCVIIRTWTPRHLCGSFHDLVNTACQTKIQTYHKAPLSQKPENENRWAFVLPLYIEFPSSLDSPSPFCFDSYAALVWFFTWHFPLALGAISPAWLWVTHLWKLNGLARNQIEQLLLVLSTVTRAILQSTNKMKGVRWQWPFITFWSPTGPWPALLELSGELLQSRSIITSPKLHPSSIWCFIKTWQSHYGHNILLLSLMKAA